MPEPDGAERRRQVAIAGHRGDEQQARLGFSDSSAAVRASALGALARMERVTAADIKAGLGDPAPEVRRRACDVAAAVLASEGSAGAVSGDDGSTGGELLGGQGAAGAGAEPPAEILQGVVALLADADPLVAEAACYALGELGAGAGVAPLTRVATGHDDPLCREAAVAALGAIGEPAGLDAILRATSDKPAVRRRAVLALAPFSGADVDAALDRARRDRDWQVRQAAEDLLAADS